MAKSSCGPVSIEGTDSGAVSDPHDHLAAWRYATGSGACRFQKKTWGQSLLICVRIFMLGMIWYVQYAQYVQYVPSTIQSANISYLYS